MGWSVRRRGGSAPYQADRDPSGDSDHADHAGRFDRVGASGRIGRVVAFIDERACSLASVRRAVRLAAERDVPLKVVFVQSHPSPLMSISALGMLAVGSAVELEDKLESELFGTVAGIVAPSRLAWMFEALPHHSAPAAMPDGSGITLVVARHFRRLVGGRLVSTVRSVEARSDGMARLVVVGCDHRSEGSLAAPVPAWS